MADSRKADYTILLRKRSKKSHKLELFCSSKWRGGWKGRFRLRLNGKWWPLEMKFYTKTEVKELFFKNIT